MRTFIGLVLALFVGRAVGETSGAGFRFEYREGLCWVQVRVVGCDEPLRFLLDSGAEVSVIHLETARHLGLTMGSRVNVRGVHTSATGYWPQTIRASANDVALPARYLAVDLSELGQACGESVDGLIGADFFRDRVVQIDFAGQTVRLVGPDETGPLADSLPLEVRSCGLRVQVSVNGNKPQWLRVDTGCATPLQWVTSGDRPDQHASQLVIGLTELSVPQQYSTVELGNHTFENVPTGVHQSPIFPGEAGLLGNGLLSRFSRVTIDGKAGRLILQ